jgi:hypothetical protein
LTAARTSRSVDDVLPHNPFPTGDAMTEKPSRLEDEYFAREDAEKLYRLHQERRKNEDAKKREEEKQLHWMKCPKCGYGLEHIQLRNHTVDKCFSCGAVVLDAGELEGIAGKEHGDGFLHSFMNLFKGL